MKLTAKDLGGSLEGGARGGSIIDNEKRRRRKKQNTYKVVKSAVNKITVPKKCKRKTCVTCSIFNEEKVITSKNTGRKYEIKNERNVEINCTTENVVYLLEYDHCKLQYVGETNQQLSRRFSSHKNNIRKYDTTKKDTQLIEHFNYGMCKDKTYNVKIIETIAAEGKKNGKMDWTTASFRRKREDYWMEELETIHPYGLNNRHGKNLDQRDDNDAVCKVFGKKRKSRNRKRRFHRKGANYILYADKVYEDN